MNKLNSYETVMLIASDIQADGIAKLEEKIKKIFTAHKVSEINRKDWGLRKLAYLLKKFKSAHYIEYNYNAPTGLVAELEKNLGYEESVLRYLTVKHTKHTSKNVQVEPDGYEFIE